MFNMVVTFVVDNNSSKHPSNRKIDSLILDESPAEGLLDTTIRVEAKYSLIFNKSKKETIFKSTLQ